MREEDEDEMNEMLLDWLSNYSSDANDVPELDVEVFWKKFFNFFMEEVMYHKSIIIDHRPIIITTAPNQSQRMNSEIGRMLHSIERANNKPEALRNFLAREMHGRAIQKICVNENSGKCIFNAGKIAEFANEFLVSVMNDQVEAEQKNRPNTSKRFKLTVQMVYDAIMNQKQSTLRSSGILLMTTEMLQKTADASSEVLFLLYQMSLLQGKVPQDWRHTLITLKHKDDRLDRIENYRPIGITCAPSKVGIQCLSFKLYN